MNISTMPNACLQLVDKKALNQENVVDVITSLRFYYFAPVCVLSLPPLDIMNFICKSAVLCGEIMLLDRNDNIANFLTAGSI